MNSINLTGRLCDTPELKTTNNGVNVCTFSLAVKRPRVKDTTDFFNCVAWRAQAEFITRYFKKGDPIEIKGILTSRKYQDQNGNSRTVIEVVCDDVGFCLTSNKDSNEHDAPANGSGYEELFDDDELPF